jgi:hypothetical protein
MSTRSVGGRPSARKFRTATVGNCERSSARGHSVKPGSR